MMMMRCSVVSRGWVIAVVVRILGVPVLAGEAALGGGDFPSVVLTAAVHALLCSGATTSP